MTGHLGQRIRDLLAAPLNVDHGVDRLGRALWLYVHLISITNSRGHICRTLDSLGKDLGIGPDRIRAWLARLVHTGLVTVQVPPPYLVIKLTFWSGGEEQHAGSSEQNGVSHIEVPVSSSKLQAAAAASNKAEDGGAGEGGVQLLAEVLRVLGETDPTEFRELVASHPHPIVLKALLRVKTTPADQIRKSKAALFRFLVNKFSHESPAAAEDPDPALGLIDEEPGDE